MLSLVKHLISLLRRQLFARGASQHLVLRYILLKGKPRLIAFKAFPLRGRWHEVPDEV